MPVALSGTQPDATPGGRHRRRRLVAAAGTVILALGLTTGGTAAWAQTPSPCGSGPCAPPTKGAPGACGPSPCAPTTPSPANACGPNPCAPPGQVTPGQGPCGAQPCAGTKTVTPAQVNTPSAASHAPPVPAGPAPGPAPRLPSGGSAPTPTQVPTPAPTAPARGDVTVRRAASTTPWALLWAGVGVAVALLAWGALILLSGNRRHPDDVAAGRLIDDEPPADGHDVEPLEDHPDGVGFDRGHDAEAETPLVSPVSHANFPDL